MSGQRRIGFIGFERANAFDITGPVEVFATANAQASGPTPYEIVLLSPDGAPFATESGLVFSPAAGLADAGRFDTLIVPGGAGLREPRLHPAIVAFLRERSGDARRVASVCTGVYGLAAAGLLDGRAATTHWRWARDVARRFPDVRLQADRIYLRDGRFWTSGGISAGIDLALALVEEDLGPRAALAVAREMLVYVKRSGGQSQYSEPLRAQVRAPDRIADLVAWISANLDADLGVETLADRAGMSPRQLARVFKTATGAAPAAFVERLRLDAAREQLVEGELSVDAVAALAGYRSADVFRRAFERRFGVSPGQHRQVFSGMSHFVGPPS